MLGPALAASIVDQNPTHRLCGGSEEVAAAVPGMPLLTLRALNESNVGFVDQRRRLERLARLFLGQLLRRQLAQLIVDERQELLSAVGVALLDGGQDVRDIAHRRHPGLGTRCCLSEFTRHRPQLRGWRSATQQQRGWLMRPWRSSPLPSY